MKHWSKVLGVSVVAVLALSAVISASASASEHWYVGGTKLAEGAEQTLTGKLTGVSTLSATLSGISISIVCEGGTTTGIIDNPKGGEAGHKHTGTHHEEPCVVNPASQGCTVKSAEATAGGTIHDDDITEEAVPGPKLKATHEGGGAFVSLELKGCKTASLNKQFELTGSTMGIVNNKESKLEYTKTSGSALFLGGSAAIYTAVFDQSVEGKSVEVKE